jgi:hypothetical protein
MNVSISTVAKDLGTTIIGIQRAITAQAANGVGIVSQIQAEQYVIDNDDSKSTAQTIGRIYQDSQI